MRNGRLQKSGKFTSNEGSRVALLVRSLWGWLWIFKGQWHFDTAAGRSWNPIRGGESARNAAYDEAIAAWCGGKEARRCWQWRMEGLEGSFLEVLRQRRDRVATTVCNAGEHEPSCPRCSGSLERGGEPSCLTISVQWTRFASGWLIAVQGPDNLHLECWCAWRDVVTNEQCRQCAHCWKTAGWSKFAQLLKLQQIETWPKGCKAKLTASDCGGKRPVRDPTSAALARLQFTHGFIWFHHLESWLIPAICGSQDMSSQKCCKHNVRNRHKHIS